MDSDPISRRLALQLSAAAVSGLASGSSLVAEAVAQPAPAAGMIPIADYLALRLVGLGCKTLFGIPGATCDPMFDAAAKRGLKPVITASDLEAGYAADGYARMRGIGAVCVTYGVGTLSLVNAIAGAYVERSPVVVINGGPNGPDLSFYQQHNTLFSHSIGAVPPRRPGQASVPEADLLGDLAVFRRCTVKAIRITRRADAPAMIDDALQTARREQRPVYIEISKALWDEQQTVPAPSASLPEPPLPPAAGEEVLAAKIITRLGAARKPVLLLGEQIARYRLDDAVTALTAKLEIPFATTFLAKSVISEQGRCFIGVYDGEHAARIVTDALFQSDAILALGCTYGRQYRKLLNDKIGVFMHAADDQFREGSDASVAASLKRLVTALNAAPWTAKVEHSHGRLLPGPGFADRRARQSPRRAELPGAGLSYDALMEKVSGFLDTSFISMTDTSLCQYPGADMNIPAKNAYVCNAIWNAIGYAPPAALGVGLAERDAGSNRRPLVICGDGGFQMTAQALSTLARNNIRAIVVILDNALYAIEEYVINQSGGYFSNPATPVTEHLKLARWDYVMLAKALGITATQKVDTLQDFTQALQTAKNAQGPAVISVTMNPRSLPSELFA